MSPKEKQFIYLVGITTCAMLIALTVLGVIPLALCVVLCLFQLVMVGIAEGKEEDEL